MSKYLQIIFIFLIFYSKEVLAQPATTPIQRGNDTIFNKNQIIVRYLGKDTIEISGWKNGKLDGQRTLFYSNKRLSSIAEFKNGWMQGAQQTFHSANGVLISKGAYKYYPKLQQSLLNGKFTRYYYSDGKLSEEYNYVQGKRNGKYKRIHPNGNLQEEGVFEDDLIKGLKKTYQLNGILRTEEQYIIIKNPDYVVRKIPKDSLTKVFLDENKSVDETNKISKKKPSEDKYVEIAPYNVAQKLSVLNGKSIYYSTNGDIQSEVKFLNGKKDGLCIEYYQNSHQMRSQVIFKNSKEHGDFVYFRQDGKKEQEGRYFKSIEANGTVYQNVYDGENIFYQDNGEKQRLENWSHFQKNGLQETYHSRIATLSSRFYMQDGLKKGLETYFDKDGIKTAETTYEIVEKDGVKTSQITGIKRSWKNGQLTSEATYKNGLIEGTYIEYYENKDTLFVKSLKTFVGGKLEGPYKTYSSSGKIELDYNYHYNSKMDQSDLYGWCSQYDSDGKLITRSFASKRRNNIIQQTFDAEEQVAFDIPEKLNITWNNQMINGLSIKDFNIILGFETYTNGKLRRIHFSHPKFGNRLTANFLSSGSVNQVEENGKVLDMTTELNDLVQRIATQFNSEWLNQKVDFSTKKGNERYEWKYKDGSPFLNFQFTDSLPSGEFTVFNPIIRGDTLQHSTFEKGEPVGNWVRKNLSGTTLYRKSFYSNHIEKEIYRYWDSGKPMEVLKQDSTKKVTFNLTFYENGQLKEHREPLISSLVYFNVNGDTTSSNWLYSNSDSIRIQKGFYANNKVKYRQFTNYKTGEEYKIGYFENGQIQYYQGLKDQKKDGLYEQFNDKGQLLRSGNFLDDKREGKWIVYEYKLKDRDSIWIADSVSYEKGELIIPVNAAASCRCYDKSLPGSSVGFANSLENLVDYKTILPAIPKNIIPVDAFNFSKIFYMNHQFSGGTRSGFADMKILPYKEFSFYFPGEDYMKFTLNPCPADGYIPNFRANIFYKTDEKSISEATLYPDRISVSLMNNPLKIAENKSDYVAFFDVKSMGFNSDGLVSIQNKPYTINCFPKAIVKETILLHINAANIVLRPASTLSPRSVPLLKNEIEKMYGLVITDANVYIDYIFTKNDTLKITGISNEIYAGHHFVAGSIKIEGKSLKESGFQLKNGGKIIFADELQRFLEDKGFFRVKVQLKDSETLEVQFFTEN